jgi:hypothetical protein
MPTPVEFRDRAQIEALLWWSCRASKPMLYQAIWVLNSGAMITLMALTA